MADKDQEFLDSLNNISKSFELLIEAIKKKVVDDKKSIVDGVGSSKEQAEAFVENSIKLDKISEDVSSTKENTELILKHFKIQNKKEKKDKKNSLFGKAKDNVTGVFDGIKTIALMAGSIVAMGMAFKLVGDVDFASVIALSVALPLLAIAFGKVNEQKISMKDALVLAGVIVIMSASIVASGFLIRGMPSISFPQFLSAIGVGVTMGVAMIPLAYAAKTIGLKGILSVIPLAQAMPFVASGIVLSGFILGQMPTISFKQFVSAIGVGIAMGVSMVPLALAAKLIGSGNTDNLLDMAFIMPFVAGGIYASAHILQAIPNMSMQQFTSIIGVGIAMGVAMIPLAIAGKLMGKDTDKLLEIAILMPVIAGAILASAAILTFIPELDTMNIIESAFAITMATTLVAGGIWVMNKMGLNIKDVAMGTLSMVILSAGLMVASQILSLGNYEKGAYPSLDWAIGVSASMIGALPSVLVLGLLVASGIGGLVILGGVAGMLVMSAGLVGVSHILSTGKYENYPTFTWAAGVGLAMMGMIPAVLGLGLVSLFPGGSTVIDLGIQQMYKLSNALVNIGSIIKGGDFSGGPTSEWSMGVGLSLMYFAQALASFKPGVMDYLTGTSFEDNIASLLVLASTLSLFPKFLGKTSTYEGTGPKKEWAEGVGLSLKYFAQALASFKEGTWGFLSGNQLDENIEGVKKLAKLLPQIPGLLGSSDLYIGTGPTKEWSEGVGGGLIGIATAMATLADEIDVEDVWKWINPMKHLAALMPFIARKMVDVDFTNYPSSKWTDGVQGFLSSFSEYTSGEGDVIKSVENIKLLSDSYLTLAKSISKLGESINSITNLPDMSNLYGGLITLSLIDSTNLKGVLEQLAPKESMFTKMSNTLRSAATTLNDYMPDVFKTKKSDNKSSSNNSQNKQPGTPQNKPPGTAKVNPIYKTNELLNKQYHVLKNIEKTMYEVSNNTKSSKSSSIG